MKKIQDCLNYISESLMMILEKNEKIFPKPGANAKFEIWVGDHGKERQEERNVSDKEIINACFGAYQDINNLYKNREIEVSNGHDDTNKFLIIDARKNKNNPVQVVGFIYRNRKENKLEHPSFTIKTVWKGDDFAGAKRNNEEQHKIFLY